MRRNMEGNESFGTAFNCMDGRTQDCVNELVKKELGVLFVDEITEPGIVKYLAGSNDLEPTVEWLKKKADISVNHHHSKGIAIVAHANCAGNPIEKEGQIIQLDKALERVKEWYPQVKVIRIWVEPKDSIWSAEKI